jgi:hypothetical protein
MLTLLMLQPPSRHEGARRKPLKTVALLNQGENGSDEVRGERTRAEQADPDQGKAERVTG